MRRLCVAFFFLFLTTFFLLSACSDSYYISFDSETYTVREGETVTPGVKVRPAKKGYVLSVDNTTVASVENGKTLRGLKDGSMTVVTATCGTRKATATLVVTSKTDPTSPDYDVRTTHYVSFVLTNYEAVGLTDERIKTLPYLDGDVVSEALPLYTGYSVDGWYFDRTCTQAFDSFSSPVHDDFTLYCRAEMLENAFIFNGLNEVSGILFPNLPHDELVLPAEHLNKPVKGIADGAFTGDALVKRVVIPACYERIGEHAFSGCTALESVTVGQHAALTEIGAFAFSVYSTEDEENVSSVVDEACVKLSTFVLPDGVETVGAFAFYGCALYAPEIPSSLTVVPYGAFYGTAITHATLTNVTTIEAFAFAECKKLAVVEQTEKVEVCEAKAFADSAIYQAGISSSPYVAYAGTILLEASNAMFGKLNLGKHTLRDDTTLIADGAFNGYNQTEVTIYFGKGGVRIGDDAFLDEDGVCLAVPEETLERYKEDNPYYAYQFCVPVEILIGEDETAVNFGKHTLLKFSETDYRYDRFTVIQNAEGLYRSPTEISFSALGTVGRFITRVNSRAINLGEGGGNLTTLRLGKVTSVAYMAVLNCKKLTRIDLTESPTVVAIEQNSFQFNSCPNAYVYVTDAAYRNVWTKDAVGTAAERLRFE